MKITVKNKIFDGDDAGFSVRISEIAKNSNERLPECTEVMTHVTCRMDNYYDANGLSEVTGSIDEKYDIVIDVCWSSDERIPEDTEIISNVKRWLEEVI